MRRHTSRRLAILGSLALAATIALLWSPHSKDSPGPPTQPPLVVSEGPGGPSPALAAAPALRDKQDGSVNLPFARGTVVDGQGQPVADARILPRLRTVVGGRALELPVATDAIPIAVTDADGRFIVQQAPVDLVSLLTIAAGFALDERRDLSTRREENQDLSIVLLAGRGLAGKVTDSEGHAIPGARVSMGWRPAAAGKPRFAGQSAVTDTSGSYSFTSLPRILELAMVSANGYTTPGFEDASAWGDRHEFVLKRSQIIVDVSDEATHQVLGDARGMLRCGGANRTSALLPVPDYGLGSLPMVAGRLYLDMNTVFGTDSAAVLDCDAIVFAPGHRTARAQVRLVRGSEAPHLLISLQTGSDDASLAGFVVGGRHARIAVFGVRRGMEHVIPDESEVLTNVKADDQGQFAVSGLPEGQYRLRIRVEGRAPLVRDVTVPSLGLRLELPAGGSLEVTVRDAKGGPASRVPLFAEPVIDAAMFRATTDEQGMARFDKLPPGPVDVAPGLGAPIAGQASKHPAGVRVVVVSGETTRTELALPHRVRWTFVVRDDDGRAVEGAVLGLRGTGYGGDETEWSRVLGLSASSDAEGRVSVELFPGIYRARVALPWGTNLEPHVEVGTQDGGEVVIVATRNVVTLRGRVVEDRTGDAIQSRPVTVSERVPRPGWLGSAVTDLDGRFEIVGLPRRPVTVQLLLQSASADLAYDANSPWPRVRVEIDLARDEPILTVVVPRVRGRGAEDSPTRLIARVRSATSDEPLMGASVSVSALRKGAWVEAGQWKTDETGLLETALIEGDRYRALVAGPWVPKGTPWQYQEFDVVMSGGTLQVDARLDHVK